MAAFIPRQGESGPKFPRTRDRSGSVSAMALRVPLSAEILLARAAAGLSRLAGAGGGTTVPGKLLWKLDPGAVDRLGQRLSAGRGRRSPAHTQNTPPLEAPPHPGPPLPPPPN